MPNVFVGHPFAKRLFPVERFRRIFEELPLTVKWVETELETRHLLQHIKMGILRADYALFDVTTWNPNVSLELGLCEGLKRRQKEYYILVNKKRAKDVPADIRGLVNLEYKSYNFKPGGLGDQFVRLLLAKEFWVKQIWKSIHGSGKGWTKRILALRIVGHLRDGKPLRLDGVRVLAKGTGLRKPDCQKVLRTLERRRIIRRGSRFACDPAYVLQR